MTSEHRPKKSNFGRQSFIGLLLYASLIMGVAFGLRVIKLNHLPLSLSLDEATNGLDALQLMRLKWLTPFLQNNFGRETLFFYMQAVALRLYGISFFSLRLASVLAATLTVPLVYAVGRRLRLDHLFLPEKINHHLNLPAVSLLAAAGLAISYWHIYFSRLSLRAILLPPLLLGLVWCFWRGWFAGGSLAARPPFSRRWIWLAAAGMLLGLTFYTYLAARLLPFLFVVFMAIELLKNKSNRKERLIGFLIFSLAAVLVVTPLILYYYQNPQAFNSRTQAISILAAGHPLPALTGNLVSLLQVHFWANTWLQEWPALNLLSALGLLVGLPVCVYHFKKPAALFLLLWWLIGTLPVLISIQDWAAPTVPLRGIVAWPALFLISAVGLATLAGAANRLPVLKPLPLAAFLPLLLLIGGGLSGAYNYFWVWATHYNNFSDHPAVMAQYLNRQTRQLTLTPLMFYGETVVHFLLQANYPTLTNIDSAQLHSLLASGRPAVYLLPARSTAESIFVLLEPNANGRGVAHLLPPLTLPQVETLSQRTQTTSPQALILDGEQEPFAHIYPLPANAPFLPAATPQTPPLQSIRANFNNDLLLSAYQVSPPVVKPGETVTLSFHWQALRPINGDYYVFIHLFDLSTGRRHGQINTPLTGLLFDAHRWPVGLAVPGSHYFTLPADAPEGVYRFEVGLYHGASQERLPVTVDVAETPDDKIILGKFHVRRQPPPPPQYPLAGIRFSDAATGESLALLGVDADPLPVLQPGQTFTYQLHWQALTPLTHNYVVFNHLLDAQGNIQAQQDHPPQQGRYPTSWWDVNEIVIDPYALALPQNLPPGPYTLRVGLYQPETGRRLELKNQPQDFVDLPNLITVQ
ncbi:MAG: hypothetical protein JW953_08105 [Anaerolineae bacterium]|nr:hypothetical protein [Anaerolineae bacterium]